MATSIVLIKSGDTTTEQINSTYIRLMSYRMLSIHPKEHNDAKIWCYAESNEGLLEGIHHLPMLPRDDYTDPAWYKIDVMSANSSKIMKGDSHQIHKIVIWDVNLFPRDTCQNTTLKEQNEAGDVSLLQPDTFDAETLSLIKEQKLPFLQMPTKWWTDDSDTEYCPFYTSFEGGGLELYTLFQSDPSKYQELYGNDVQKFIEKEFKGVVLPTLCGEFGIYYIGNRERNDTLLEEWKERVQCYFPQEWHCPIEEDMDADYLSYDHEWRTISPQVRFLYANTDQGTLTRDDLWFRTWIHSE